MANKREPYSPATLAYTTINSLRRAPLIVGPPKSAASRRRLSIASGLVPLLETALAEPGIAARGRGYAVTREDPTDRDRADLGWSADPSDPDRLLFVTARGYPIRHNQFYKRIFAPVVASALPARLAGFRWHDLRHTCAALSLAEGGSLHHVKERLGAWVANAPGRG
jgi:integrase